METYFFTKTVAERGRIRLRPIPGQKVGGVDVITSMNVQADRDIRTKYPLGTIYGSKMVENLGSFYNVPDRNIFPLTSLAIEPSHEPPKEMVNTYLSFIGSTDSTLILDGIDIGKGTSKSVEVEIKPKKTLLDRIYGNKKFKVPTIKTDGFFVERDIWYLIMRNILTQKNTMLVGPTGSGKTEIISLMADRMGIECSVYDMGSMYDPVAGLLGVHRLEKGGISLFDYAKFTQDIQKPGIIVLDELSRAPVTTNNILFPCLDSRRMLPVEIAGGNDMRGIKVHEDCVFVATANIGAEYTGTMSMDKALVNRFFPVEMDYLSQKDEAELLRARTGILSTDASVIASVASSIRNLASKQDISTSISTRETLMIGELVADGWSLLFAMEKVILPMYEGTRLEGERGVVCKLLTTR
jgi:MoxR-like ATPase